MVIVEEYEININDVSVSHTAAWMVVLFTEIRDTGSGQGLREVRGIID